MSIPAEAEVTGVTVEHEIEPVRIAVIGAGTVLTAAEARDVASAGGELAAVKDADRATKAATKAKSRGGAAHPVRAAKSAARKSGGRAAGKGRHGPR